MMSDKDILDAMRRRMPPWCRDGFLAGYRGSHAHGTYVPPSDPKGIDDIDVFMVFINRPQWYWQLESLASARRTGRHYETAGEELDIVAYEIQKFVDLLCKGNPNVHCWLWMRPQDFLVSAGPAFYLIKNREAFLSQKVLDAFAGYAASQLRKMERFEHYGRMGAKRKELVAQHGYDCKNAAHLIRLLTMGAELAETGTLTVYRTDDAEMLKAIKTGGWTLERVKQYSDNLWERLNEARKDCEFPTFVDKSEANKILLGCMERWWELKEEGFWDG